MPPNGSGRSCQPNQRLKPSSDKEKPSSGRHDRQRDDLNIVERMKSLSVQKYKALIASDAVPSGSPTGQSQAHTKAPLSKTLSHTQNSPSYVAILKGPSTPDIGEHCRIKASASNREAPIGSTASSSERKASPGGNRGGGGKGQGHERGSEGNISEGSPNPKGSNTSSPGAQSSSGYDIMIFVYRQPRGGENWTLVLDRGDEGYIHVENSGAPDWEYRERRGSHPELEHLIRSIPVTELAPRKVNRYLAMIQRVTETGVSTDSKELCFEILMRLKTRYLIEVDVNRLLIRIQKERRQGQW
jgi:hypothetical protein